MDWHFENMTKVLLYEIALSPRNFQPLLTNHVNDDSWPSRSVATAVSICSWTVMDDFLNCLRVWEIRRLLQFFKEPVHGVRSSLINRLEAALYCHGYSEQDILISCSNAKGLQKAACKLLDNTDIIQKANCSLVVTEFQSAHYELQPLVKFVKPTKTTSPEVCLAGIYFCLYDTYARFDR